jgi:hypothetical protein
MVSLSHSVAFDFVVLAETQRHLDALAMDQEAAKRLVVPDGSRSIFDTTEKLQGLLALSLEMDDLLRQVAREHNGLLGQGMDLTLPACREIVAGIRLPPT